MRSHYGNRGMAFEMLINMTNEQYKNQEVALINKRPTPVKVIKSRGTQITKAAFESKSTVDYDGVYRGLSITFEAKSVGEKRFDLKHLQTHQMQYLNTANMHGAIAFLLIEIRPMKKVFLVPYKMIAHYWKKAHTGGRKSIPLDELEVYGYEVKQGRRVLLDYLAIIDQLVQESAV